MRLLKLFLFLCLFSYNVKSASLNVIRDAETENQADESKNDPVVSHGGYVDHVVTRICY